jgi:HAD superfamily hydrolase (TIGR01509 family)
MTSPRAYLFDLDGTLIDEFGTIHGRYVHTMARMGLPAPTEAQVRAAVGGGLENGLGRFVPPARIPEAMAIYREFWERTILDGVRLLPGARELLDALHRRGAVLAVITNKPGKASRMICGHLGISPLFCAVVGAGDTAWLKPQPELTAHVLALAGASPGEAVLVGDSPYDVKAAHAGGLPAWCVATGTHGADELRAGGADAVYASLADLGRGAGVLP